jgi:hypothetical protein
MAPYISALTIFLVLIADLESTATGSPTAKYSRPPLPTNIKFKQELDPSNQILQDPSCELSPALLQEIRSYQPIADQIIAAAVSGAFKGKTYDELAKFVDKYVNRLTGSQELEDSIDYMIEKMTSDGLDNVRGESVQVPRWIRFVKKPLRILH